MGIVYMIKCNETGECYIGSANTKQCYIGRKSEHKCSDRYSISSKQIIDRGNYTFSIIEENIFIDTELRKREQYWIDTSDHVINKNRAYTSFELKKAQRILKKEQKKEYDLEYSIKHKEQIKIRKSIYYHCECGSVIQIGNKSIHIKSKKHQKYLNELL